MKSDVKRLTVVRDKMKPKKKKEEDEFGIHSTMHILIVGEI